MESCVTEILNGNRLIATLNELCKENFNVSDDTILNKLFNNIERYAVIRELLNSFSREVGDWLESMVSRWESNDLAHGVKIFVIQCIGLFGAKVEGFEQVLRKRNILVHIEHLKASSQCDASLMVHLIMTIERVTLNQAGWEWVTTTKLWTCAVEAVYRIKSIYVERAATDLVTSLLIRSDKYSKTDTGWSSVEVLLLVCKPLVDHHVLVVDEEGAGQTCVEFSGEKELVTAARFVCNVLEQLMSLATEPLTTELLLVTRPAHNSVLLADILKNCTYQRAQVFSRLMVLVGLNNAACKRSRPCEHECPSPGHICPLDNTYDNCYKAINTVVGRVNCSAVVELCVSCLSLVHKYKHKTRCCSICNCASCYDFGKTVTDCMVVLLRLRLEVFSSEQTSPERVRPLERSDVAETLAVKALSDECVSVSAGARLIQRVVGAVARAVNFLKDKDLVADIIFELLETLSFLLDRLTLFQTAIEPLLLDLLACLAMLTSQGKLPSGYLLKLPSLTHVLDSRVTVTALQFYNKFLKALPLHVKLSDEARGEHMPSRDEMTALEAHLHSHTWEVRDTALEVFQTLARFSEPDGCFLRYPNASSIITQILNLAVNDESSYVRASSFGFILCATESNLLDLKKSGFPQELLTFAAEAALHDRMPNVRQAACEIVNSLYMFYTPSVYTDPIPMYDMMFVVTMQDLHWEVKKKALEFWRITVKKVLAEKQVHKLSHIRPTDREEAIRPIVEAMDALGEIGCLKAIWVGLNDDCDIEVSQQALVLLNDLQELDRKWNFTETILNQESSGKSISEGVETSCKKLLPKEFFTQVQKQDWEEVLSSRSKWIVSSGDNLSSIMDQILNEDNKLDDCEHNAVDCY